MRVVHFSDWHGRKPRSSKLPAADLYVCTGDMLPNFGWPLPDEWWADMEAQRQRAWMQAHPFDRACFESPDSPVVCVRGNHDFTDLAPWFEGMDVFEIGKDPTRVFEFAFGLVFRCGGMRGVNFIGMDWSDEEDESTLLERAAALPDIDILVTHAPAKGVLDDGYGVAGFSRFLNRQNPLAHCFGHIHERAGVERLGDTLFSNAATRVNVLDL